MFISITVLEEGKKRQIRMRGLFAHIAFHEIMPLQEFFEETAIFQATSLQLQVIHQWLSFLGL